MKDYVVALLLLFVFLALFPYYLLCWILDA